MLALGVQEQSQLLLLESSLSNTVNHQWPILHAQFIDEPTSSQDPGELGHLKIKDQETQPPTQAEFSKTVEIIRVPELSCYSHWHYKGHDPLNSNVMLGSLESISSMEVNSATEMVSHDSSKSPAVRDRGDLLRIVIHPEFSTDPHIKDDQTVSEPMSNKPACTENMNTEAGLHTEPNERPSNLHPDSNDPLEITEYENYGKLPDIYNLPAVKPQHSVDHLSDGHEECNLVMSQKDTCPSLKKKDDFSSLCLDNRELPLLSSISPNSPGDTCKCPIQLKESLVCKENYSHTLEVGSENLRYISSEGNPLFKSAKPPVKSCENDLQSVTESSNVDAQQSKISCADGQYKNVHPLIPLGHVETADSSLECLHSHSISKDLLSKDDTEIQLTDDLSIQPRLSASLENQLGAKLCDESEHSLSPYTCTDDVSAVFSKNLTCTNKLGDSSDLISNTNSIVSGTSVSACGQPSCIDACLLSDNAAFSFQKMNSDAIGQEGEVTLAENVATVIDLCPSSRLIQEITQTSNMMPATAPNLILSCEMVTDGSLQMSPENKTDTLQTSNAGCMVLISDIPNGISNLEHTLFSSHIQSYDLTYKETNHSSEPCEVVPSQMASDCGTFRNCRSSHHPLSLKATAQNALVPYVDFWSSITKPKKPNVWLRPPRNIIQKAKCRTLKESSILYAKGKGHSGQDGTFVHSFSPSNILQSLRSPFFYRFLKEQSGYPIRICEGTSFIHPTIKAKTICPSSLDSVGLGNRSVSLLPVNTRASKLKCYTPKLENLQLLNLFNCHGVGRKDFAGPKSLSNIEHADGIKHVPPAQFIVTRSRRKTVHGSPDYLCTVKPALPPMLPKKITLNTLADEHRPACTALKTQSRTTFLPELEVGAGKRKRINVKAEKIPKVKIDKKVPPLLDKCFPNETAKDCLGKTMSCQMGKKPRTAKCIKNSSLKLETQSLNSCATQEAKRPKICNRNCSQPIISDFQRGIETISSTKNVFPPPPRPSSHVKKVQSVPNMGPVICEMPLKIQPFRKCKNTTLQQNMHFDPKMQACKLTSNFPTNASYVLNHKALPSGQVANNAPNLLNAVKKSMATPCMKRTRLQTSTPEQALLHQLSAIANRLMEPSEGSLISKASSSTTRVIPFRGVRLQARKLLNVFSCMNMQMSSMSAGSMAKTSRGHLLSQSMDLFPTHFRIGPNDITHQFSFPALNNSTFPVSFHMKLDPSILADFIRFNPPDYMVRNALPMTQLSPLSEWTLSVFLSPHIPTSDDNVQLFTDWNPHFRSLESSRCNSNYKSVSTRTSGCSMLGLHTVLALSSPGCFRLWTRKRNLGSRMPTVQKLSVMQFAHGLKGLPQQNSQKRSLAFLLGNVLSMWSRHGSSVFSYDSTTPHSHCRLWQPGKSEISPAQSRLCTAPKLSLDVGRWNFLSLPPLNLPLDLLPKNCLGANKPSFSLSSSPEIDFSPSSCLPVLSSPVNSLSSEKSVRFWHSYTIASEQGSSIGHRNSLAANPETTLPILCSEESSVLEPELPLSVRHGDKIDPWSDFFNGQSDALGLSDFSSCKQNNGTGLLDCSSTKPLVSILHNRVYAVRLNASLPAEQVQDPGPSCLPSKLGDGLRTAQRPFSEKNTGSLHGLRDSRIPFSLAKKQGDALGLSQFLSSRLDHLQTPRCLSPGETNGLESQLVLPPQKESPYGSLHQSVEEDNHFGKLQCMFSKQECDPENLHNLSNKQNGNLSAFPPSDPKLACRFLPTKVCSLEQRKTVPVLESNVGNFLQANEKQEVERKPQRVSQIKIRKTIPKPDPNLTPMGLPKPKRINKKEFTLEDIYTNKNYKSPPARSLETIFEEPKEKNGVLISVSQTKRKRILEFRDCTMPRPKRAKGKVRVMASCKRGRKAAMEGVQLDALLIQKLMNLENFLLEQEALERGSAVSDNLS